MFTKLLIETMFNKIALHSIFVLKISEVRWSYSSEFPLTRSASVPVVAASAVDSVAVVVDSLAVVVDSVAVIVDSVAAT